MNKLVKLIITNIKSIFQNTNWTYYYDYGSQRTHNRNTAVFAANRIRENFASKSPKSLTKLCESVIVIINITFVHNSLTHQERQYTT
jgi:hypothetical protein